MRIRTKLSLYVTAVILVTTTAIATLAYRLQKDIIEDNFARNRVQQVESLATICGQSLTVNNDLLLINYIRLLASSPSIEYAYFVDQQGQIRIHSDQKFLYRPVSDWARHKIADSQEESANVYLGSKTAGQAVIGYSRSFEKQSLDQALRRTMTHVLAASGAVAAIAVFLAALFSTLFTRPLKALSEGSERVARGDFGTEVPVVSRDEVGELAARFNSMSKSLAALDEMKDQFIAGVTHDLRGPLAAIKMSCDYMLHDDSHRDTMDPRYRETFAMIMDNTTKLNLFVTNVLDLAKIKAGRMEYFPKPVMLDAIAANLGKLFGAVARKKSISLVNEVPLDMPPLLADSERLDQALANLMSNALKFTPPGGRVTIGAKTKGGNAEIFVADTGTGIPKDQIALLFQAFNQIGAAQQRQNGMKGTGLGLFMVKQTVDGLKGRITVESAEGNGTRFVITLPLADTSPVATTTKMGA